MNTSNYTISEERISAKEYIEFLKRTDLGSQYPRERFGERIKKMRGCLCGSGLRWDRRYLPH